MNNTVYIGLDDTDIIGSRGTGRVARNLADLLVETGLGDSLGITRHQLLVDERIPYTSHNSSLCVAIETDAAAGAFHQICSKFMADNFLDGADPGLCICSRNDVSQSMLDFGRQAQQVILNKYDAVMVALRNNIFLKQFGGTGGGIIGALSAVALRKDGNSGRYVDLSGIRSIEGLVTVGEIKNRTAIIAVQSENGQVICDDEYVESNDWIRPALMKGEPVLVVKCETDSRTSACWATLKKKNGAKKKG